MAEALQTLEKDQLGAISTFLAHLGVQKIELGSGWSRVFLKVGPDHANRSKTVHGGVLASLLDVAVGSASSTLLGSEGFSVTVSLTVDYIQTAREGQQLIAEGKVVKKGARIIFAEAVVQADGGELVARGSAIIAIRPRQDQGAEEGG